MGITLKELPKAEFDEAFKSNIEKAAQGLIEGANVSCERIDELLNVAQSKMTELEAHATKLKDLIKRNADDFAQRTRDFLVSVHKLDSTFESEHKRINGKSVE